MNNRFISKIKDFVCIADIFGYLLVCLIACSLWFTYQKAENAARSARIVAKLKIDSTAEQISQLTKKELNNQKDLSTNINQISNNTETLIYKIFSYINSIKGKISNASLESIGLGSAKNTVSNINNSFENLITDVSSEYLDPRDISKSKGTPKEKQATKSDLDSLAPF